MRGKLFLVLIGIVVVLAAIPYIAIFPRQEAKHENFEETPYDTIIPGVDSDGDGLRDKEEDADGDGILDPDETDPYKADSDSDGINDGEEYVFWRSTKENISERGVPVWAQERYDNESIQAIRERFGPYGDLDNDGSINLRDIDSDNDGLTDGEELKIGTNPADPDSDKDGIPDGEEEDPLDSRDEDEDKIPDDWEDYHNVDDPQGDPDHDNRTNLEEFLNGSDPRHPGQGKGSLGDLPPSAADDFYGSDLNRILFLVEPETDPSYWRLTTYDTYDITSWSDPGYQKQVYDGNILDVDPPVVEKVVHKTFGIKFWGSSSGYLPTAHNTNLIFNISFNGTNNTGNIYRDEGGNFYSPSFVRSYHFSHERFLYDNATLLNATVPPGETVPHLLSIPNSTRNRIGPVMNNITGIDKGAPYGSALKIIRYLDENYEYNISTVMDPGRDWAVQFLTDVKEGKCIDFATAFVLLGRAAGLPSRLVVGFSPGNREEGYRVVREGHRHAWAEVYFNELGWLPFETTPYNNAPHGGTGIESDGSDPTVHTWDGSPADGHGTNQGREENKTTDSDNDNLTDWEENNLYGTDPLRADTDGDGLNDSAEILEYETDPVKQDTDEDALTDGEEVNVFGTDPLLADTDGDGLMDGEELGFGTDPLNTDTDADGLPDLIEIRYYHTDPLTNDTDEDRILDPEEVFWGKDQHLTDPASPDTDDDGLGDYAEIHENDTDPNDPDTDRDGLKDGEEIDHKTKPHNPDTDGDGLKDGYEVHFSHTNPLAKDSDGDGLEDGFEIWTGRNPLLNERGSPLLDSDNDGLPQFMEVLIGTDPNSSDSDKDDLWDGAEVFSFFTDPSNNDTDDDGLTDRAELFYYFTDPLIEDTDGDGLTDSNETLSLHTNPHLPDTDGDGINDGRELEVGTDPKTKDTDKGGMWDGYEIWNTKDPLDKNDDRDVVDSDGDGVSDAKELAENTDKEQMDTDGDGLWDGYEIFVWSSDPLKNDTDGDGLTDALEVRRGTDPSNNDTDSDGLGDRVELEQYHTDPAMNDTDGDSVEDGEEITVGTDPLDPDTDTDGLWDGDEARFDTNPRDRDTDGGGALDGVEIYSGDHDPLDPEDDEDLVDSDSDGLNDYVEKNVYDTDPYDFDSDDDSLGDGAEVEVHETDPLSNDTDNDTILDGQEVNVYHTDPLSNDTDEDNLTDDAELGFYNTDPKTNDTDGDELSDWMEIFVYNTNPRRRDTDNDGLSDSDEFFEHGTDPLINDTDEDGMPDGWEVGYELDPLNGTDSVGDLDFDDLSNIQEFLNGTDPTSNDTDSDGLSDSDELFLGTDPLDQDTDNDDLSDWDEVFTYNTNPLDRDTDGDNLTDDWEIKFGLNPNSASDKDEDADSDGLTNLEEYRRNTHPKNHDTDSDGLWDGDEVHQYGTSPLTNDTDEDRISDYDEIWQYETDPLINDTDSDGLNDNKELFVHSTDPLLNDTDSDGLRDGDEIHLYETSPLTNDTDDDGLTDFEELRRYGTDPLTNDTDTDGLSDWKELFVHNTDPTEADTDGGGMDDGTEIALGRDPLDPEDDEDPVTDIITTATVTKVISAPTNITKLETKSFQVVVLITAEGGAPIQDMRVSVYMNETLDARGELVGMGETGVDGRSSVKCQMPGGFKVGMVRIRVRTSTKKINSVIYSSSWDKGETATLLYSPTTVAFIDPPPLGTVYKNKRMNGTVYLKDGDNIPIAGANVSVFWEDRNRVDIVTDRDGRAEFTFVAPNELGRYTLYATFFGSRYLFSSNSSRVMLISGQGVDIFMDPILDTNPTETFLCGSSVNISGHVYGDNKTPVESGKVLINIRGRDADNAYLFDQVETVTGAAGRYNASYRFLKEVWPAGRYNVYAEFKGGEYYPPGAAPSEKYEVFIIGTTSFAYTVVEAERDSSVTFSSKLLDNTMKGVEDQTVNISYMGTTIIRTTGPSGKFSFRYEVQRTHPLGPVRIALYYPGDLEGERQRFRPSSGEGKILISTDTKLRTGSWPQNVTRGDPIILTGKVLDDDGDPAGKGSGDVVPGSLRVYIYMGNLEVHNTTLKEDGSFESDFILPLSVPRGDNEMRVVFEGGSLGYRASEATEHVYVFADTRIGVQYSAFGDIIEEGTPVDVEITLTNDKGRSLGGQPLQVSYGEVTENYFTNSFGRVNFTTNFPSDKDSFVISVEYPGSKIAFYKAKNAKKTIVRSRAGDRSTPNTFTEVGKEFLPIVISLLLIGGILFYWYKWRKRHLVEMKSLFEEAMDLLETSDEVRQVIYSTYVKMLKILRRYGFIRKEHQTPMEFYDALSRSVPMVSSDSIFNLTDLFEEARYSEHIMDSRDEFRAMKHFRVFRKEMGEEDGA